MILVAGASGNIGRSLVRQLKALGEPVRILVRRRPPAHLTQGVEVFEGDLERLHDLVPAFAGVMSMFLLTPPAGHGSVARLAYDHGVEHVVLLSSIATQKADPRTNAIAGRHFAAEQAVIASGMTWTLLRPDTFASNALDWACTIRSQGVVRAAYGNSQRCPIHEDDVAGAAVAALTDPAHQGAAYWLTGPETIAVRQQVEAIARAICKPIGFEELQRDQALEFLAQKMPRPAAERLLDYAAKSVSQPPKTTDMIELLLGRRALSFDRWARDHAAEFM